ncbi:hypothetical protein C5F59_028130 [Streptomyces sp. QL37]|uniref:hypothetical protein n=1 Tax=Streptomyces sp. QL37 TaxID=2093747 RepID=UPI000CF1D847|nr:hypothetical protein [Streptomyces sp. QL37]PPQ57027.1 hypothetical protein C5F59_10320 [Streptomyces sp. QL37]
MTACAIEDETAGAVRTTAAAGPTPEAAEPDGPAEPVKPLGAGAPDEGADPAGEGAPDEDADPGGGVPTGPEGAVASTGSGPHDAPAGTAALAGTNPHGASVPPAPSVPPVLSAPPGAPSEPPSPPAPSAPPAQAASRPDRAETSRLRPPSRPVPPALTLAADHAYAARLTPAGEAAGPGWLPERWTLDGPEPYAVPLPLDQPEDASSDVLPLSDGRVLIRREVEPRTHTFSLLYPTGPGTGEVSLGALDCPELALLPPSPDGMSAYALLPGERSTGVWLVAGGAFGPERVADVPGRCSGGVWLDREGRLLALDRQMPGGGPVKAVVVDLERGGEVTPLLQIAPESNDRLLMADADSGLLLVRSDAPGHDRLGWGVLGSCLPMRFPECLRAPDGTLTPFAVQPGQMLMPESCAVALRIDGAAGSWVGLWRPAGRRLHQFAAPGGWLTGSGFWTREGVLHLPYSQEGAPCAVALLEAPVDEPHPAPASGTNASGATPARGVCTPVPLGQAPLTGRGAPG